MAWAVGVEEERTAEEPAAWAVRQRSLEGFPPEPALQAARAPEVTGVQATANPQGFPDLSGLACAEGREKKRRGGVMGSFVVRL